MSLKHFKENIPTWTLSTHPNEWQYPTPISQELITFLNSSLLSTTELAASILCTNPYWEGTTNADVIDRTDSEMINLWMIDNLVMISFFLVFVNSTLLSSWMKSAKYDMFFSQIWIWMSFCFRSFLPNYTKFDFRIRPQIESDETYE